MQKIENPTGQGGASRMRLAGQQKRYHNTAKVHDIQVRIAALFPSLPSETLPVREQLTVARDYASSRLARPEAWPGSVDYLHQLVIQLASEAVFANWRKAELELAVSTCRHLVFAANGVRDLGNEHGQ